jgi:hypothetical protein
MGVYLDPVAMRREVTCHARQYTEPWCTFGWCSHTCTAKPRLRRDWAHPSPHLRRDWAHPSPHLRRNWAHPSPHLRRDCLRTKALACAPVRRTSLQAPSATHRRHRRLEAVADLDGPTVGAIPVEPTHRMRARAQACCARSRFRAERRWPPARLTALGSARTYRTALPIAVHPRLLASLCLASRLRGERGGREGARGGAVRGGRSAA